MKQVERAIITPMRPRRDRLREIRVVLECTANKQQNDDKISENNDIIFMWSRKSQYESNSGISSHTRIEHRLYSADVNSVLDPSEGEAPNPFWEN